MVRNFLKRFAYKYLMLILHKSLKIKWILQDFYQNTIIFSNNFEENLMILKRKHLVDAFGNQYGWFCSGVK